MTGANLTSAETHYGRAMSARSRRGWQHPWTVTPRWMPRIGAHGEQLGRWHVTVLPGFVNGVAPIVRTSVAEQQVSGRDFVTNPLTGKRFFSDPIFSQEGVSNVTREIDIPIYLDPLLAMNWRAVGWDGGGQYPVPQFFLDRGAADKAGEPTVEQIDAGTAPEAPGRPAGLRLLRACDVILHQPRLALTSFTTQEPGPATGISNVTQTLALRSAPASDALQIIAGTLRTDEEITPATGFAPLDFQYDEPTWDELLIATVFLLSPPGTPDGSAPDGTWTPYVREALWWNLNYEPADFHPLPTDPGIPFIPPLAAGAAQIVINFLTASLNDMTQQALNVAQAHSMAGTWWTPTGGGHSSAFPAPRAKAAAAGMTGGDKAGRLAAQEAARQAARRAVRLNPAFPFEAIAFDPDLLAA